MVQNGGEIWRVESACYNLLGGPRQGSSIVNVDIIWIGIIRIENVDSVCVLATAAEEVVERFESKREKILIPLRDNKSC